MRSTPNILVSKSFKHEAELPNSLVPRLDKLIQFRHSPSLRVAFMRAQLLSGPLPTRNGAFTAEQQSDADECERSKDNSRYGCPVETLASHNHRG